MASFVFRRAQPPDYPAILQLQSANFIANLSAEERKEGFLSAQFTPGQVSRMAEDLGTTLATSNGELPGFLCAFRNEFDHGSPVIAKMLDTYDLVTFDDQPLRSYRSYIYGPVCIHRDYRRRGLLRWTLRGAEAGPRRAVRRRRRLRLSQQSPFFRCSHRGVGDDRGR